MIDVILGIIVWWIILAITIVPIIWWMTRIYVGFKICNDEVIADWAIGIFVWVIMSILMLWLICLPTKAERECEVHVWSMETIHKDLYYNCIKDVESNN